jgi:hypothetical protein
MRIEKTAVPCFDIRNGRLTQGTLNLPALARKYRHRQYILEPQTPPLSGSDPFQRRHRCNSAGIVQPLLLRWAFLNTLNTSTSHQHHVDFPLASLKRAFLNTPSAPVDFLRFSP